MQQALQLAAAAQWEDGSVLRGTFARVYRDTTAPSQDADVPDIHLAAATGITAAVELALFLGLQPGSFSDGRVAEGLGLLGSCMPAFDQEGRAVRHYAGGDYSVEVVLPVVRLLGKHGWRVGNINQEGCHYGPACLAAALRFGNPELVQALFLAGAQDPVCLDVWWYELSRMAHAQDMRMVQLLLDLLGRTSSSVGMALLHSAHRLDVVAMRELLAAGANPEAFPLAAGDSLLHYLAHRPQNTQELEVSA
jgi:hypothetical protein